MYELLNNPIRVTMEEVEKMYRGKWVFITNIEKDSEDSGKVISGIPRVLGDRDFHGSEDGIYEEFKSDDYGILYSCNLIPPLDFVGGYSL